MVSGEASDGGHSIQDDRTVAEQYSDDDFVASDADGEQAAMSTWQHQSPAGNQAADRGTAASSNPETNWQPSEQQQGQHQSQQCAEEGHNGVDVWHNTEEGEPVTWVTWEQEEAESHQHHPQRQQQHARPKTRSGWQQQHTSSSASRGRDCVFRRPPTASRCSQGPAPRPACAGQTWSTTHQLLSQRPVSACLRSIDLTKLPSSSSSRAGTPGSLLAAAVAVVRPSTAGADMSACGRVKRYTPGPASYTPRVDRHCTTLINSAAGSFPRASKDHCSHIQAHLQTVCSPGPAAAGAPRPHSSCNAYGNTSRSSSRSRSGSPTGHLLTARLQHTPGGTWCRSGVGTRESLRPKTAPARSSGGGSSSSGSGSRGDAKNDHEQQQQQQEQCVCRGGTSSCREGTCGMPWGEHLGPGRYDAAVQRDGSAVWFGSNGGGWTWGKAPKLASPVTQTRSITYISSAHAREMCGAATPGPQHYQPRHPGVLSHPAGTAACDAGAGLSMEGKGVNVWARAEAAARDTPGFKVRNNTSPTHKGKPLWPATPAACINRPTSSRPQQPFLSARHCITLNHSSHRSKTHYAYDPGYTQQDRHVGVPHLGSGQQDRFDDYRFSSGRLQ